MPLMVSVKGWVAALPTPLLAIIVMEYIPCVSGPGVPPSTPLTAPNEIPAGSAPVSLKVGDGKPVAVTLNVPGLPTVKLVLFALVIAGA
jgi:hypothetical protein